MNCQDAFNWWCHLPDQPKMKARQLSSGNRFLASSSGASLSSSQSAKGFCPVRSLILEFKVLQNAFKIKKTKLKILFKAINEKRVLKCSSAFLLHFKFENWRIWFLMSWTGYLVWNRNFRVDHQWCCFSERRKLQSPAQRNYYINSVYSWSRWSLSKNNCPEGLE